MVGRCQQDLGFFDRGSCSDAGADELTSTGIRECWRAGELRSTYGTRRGEYRFMYVPCCRWSRHAKIDDPTSRCDLLQKLASAAVVVGHAGRRSDATDQLEPECCDQLNNSRGCAAHLQHCIENWADPSLHSAREHGCHAFFPTMKNW